MAFWALGALDKVKNLGFTKKLKDYVVALSLCSRSPPKRPRRLPNPKKACLSDLKKLGSASRNSCKDS
jgi:hypothetical protein